MTTILLDIASVAILLAWLALLTAFVALAVALAAAAVRAFSPAAHNLCSVHAGRAPSGERLRSSDAQLLRDIGIRR